MITENPPVLKRIVSLVDIARTDQSETARKVIARDIWHEIKQVEESGRISTVDYALNNINEKLKGYGVEPLRGEFRGGYYGDVEALYVNRGDTYSTTILYDTRKKKFYITSWGDLVEREPRRFQNPSETMKKEKNPPPIRRRMFMGKPIDIQEFEGGTWLEGEEAAYPSGRMLRRGKAIDEDTNLLTLIYAGIADTFYTIPAYTKEFGAGRRGRKIRGYLHIKDNKLYFKRSMIRTRSGQIDPSTEEEETLRMIEDTRVIKGNPPPKNIPREVLTWLHDQPKDSIMSIITFNKIYRDALKRYKNEVTAKNVAGKAYWNAVMARYDQYMATGNPPLYWDKSVGDLGEAENHAIRLQDYLELTKAPDKILAHFYRIKYILGQVKGYLSRSHGSDFKFYPNPPRQAETEVYRDIIQIKAKKKDGRLYMHNFKPGSSIFGLSDGSILIKSRKGKKLWKDFPKGRK